VSREEAASRSLDWCIGLPMSAGQVSTETTAHAFKASPGHVMHMLACLFHSKRWIFDGDPVYAFHVAVQRKPH